MSRISESQQQWRAVRQKVLGLGERSIQKSYYPELQRRVAELDEARRSLEERIAERTRELQASEARFRAVFEGAGIGMALLDVKGRTLVTNPALQQLTGLSPQELKSLSLADQLGVDATNSLGGTTDGAPDPDRARFECRLATRGGEAVWASVTQTVLREEGGAPQYTVLMVEDISHRKKLEEQLIRSERDAAVGTLSRGVAHQFNNINSCILGFAELAMAAQPDGDQQLVHYLSRILRAAVRAKEITERLQAFSSRAPEHPSRGNLTQVARDTMALMAPDLEVSGIEISQQLAAVPDTALDSSQISQVLVTLLLNARDALLGRREKRIAVETGRAGCAVYLRVSDTGCGIARDDLSRVFTPFFSTKGEHASTNSPQAHVKGTGLGLSVASTIALNHGGELTVESQPDVGSSFTLRLPAGPAATGERPDVEVAGGP